MKRSTLTPNEFRDAIARVPDLWANDLWTIGGLVPGSSDAALLAERLGLALREYVIAHLSELGIAEASRKLSITVRRAKRKQASGKKLTPEEAHALLVAGKRQPTRHRHLGDVHMEPLLIEVAVGAARIHIPVTARKDAPHGDALAQFTSKLFGVYAEKLRTSGRAAMPNVAAAMDTIAAQLRRSPSALNERIDSLRLTRPL